MSWEEPKKSADALRHQKDFEKAMKIYAAAAEAATAQNATSRDIAKCYTDASQMAWMAWMADVVLFPSTVLMKNSLLIKSVDFAKVVAKKLYICCKS